MRSKCTQSHKACGSGMRLHVVCNLHVVVTHAAVATTSAPTHTQTPDKRADVSTPYNTKNAPAKPARLSSSE